MCARRRGSAGPRRAGGRHRPAVAGAGRPDPPHDLGPAAGTAAGDRGDRRAVPGIADRGDAPPGRAVAGGPGDQPQAGPAAVALPEHGPAAKTAPAVGRPMEPIQPTIDLALDIEIAGPPAVVFAALTKDIGGWWGHPFVTARATSLALDPRLGGLFTERWDNGGQVIASVTGWAQDEH